MRALVFGKVRKVLRDFTRLIDNLIVGLSDIPQRMSFTHRKRQGHFVSTCSNGRLGAEEAFGLCEIDEAFQAEQWGWDAEAARRREHRKQEVADAARFLTLAEADA